MKKNLSLFIVFTMVFATFLMSVNDTVVTVSADGGLDNGMEFIWEPIAPGEGIVGAAVDKVYRLTVKLHTDANSSDGMESFTPDDPVPVDNSGRYVNMYGFAVKFDPAVLNLVAPGSGTVNTQLAGIGSTTRSMQIPTTDKFTTDSSYASDSTLINNADDGLLNIVAKGDNSLGYASMACSVLAAAKSGGRETAYGVSGNGQVLLKNGSIVVAEIYFRLVGASTPVDIDSTSLTLDPIAFGGSIPPQDAPKGSAIFTFDSSSPVIATQAIKLSGFPEELSSVSITTQPTKMAYIESETLDLTDVEVELDYSVSGTKSFTLEEFLDEGGTFRVDDGAGGSITNIVFDASGNITTEATMAMNGKKITAVYEGVTGSTSGTLSLTAKGTASGITVGDAPAAADLEVFEGATLRSILSGMTVQVTYDSGLIKNVPIEDLPPASYTLTYGTVAGSTTNFANGLDTVLTPAHATGGTNKIFIKIDGVEQEISSTPLTVNEKIQLTVANFTITGKTKGSATLSISGDVPNASVTPASGTLESDLKITYSGTLDTSTVGTATATVNLSLTNYTNKYELANATAEVTCNITEASTPTTPDSGDDSGGGTTIVRRSSGVSSPTYPGSPRQPSIVVATFGDSNFHWARNYIANLSERGIINGYDADTFGPDRHITREEIAAIIVRAMGWGSQAAAYSASTFTDSAYISSWASGPVAFLAQRGVLRGYEDGTFRPQNNITREELVVVLTRVMQSQSSIGRELSFRDNSSISSWAQSGISLALERKMIQGYEDNTFQPANSVTRAEAAVMVYNLLCIELII